MSTGDRSDFFFIFFSSFLFLPEHFSALSMRCVAGEWRGTAVGASQQDLWIGPDGTGFPKWAGLAGCVAPLPVVHMAASHFSAGRRCHCTPKTSGIRVFLYFISLFLAAFQCTSPGCLATVAHKEGKNWITGFYSLIIFLFNGYFTLFPWEDFHVCSRKDFVCLFI